MLETLIGSALGGIFRFIPEIFKMIDKKDERKHELDMMDKQIEYDENRSKLKINEVNAQGEIDLNSKEWDAIIEATKAQSTITGVKWVDAISSLMRPLITFWWVIVLYTAALGAQYFALYGISHNHVDVILKLWGSDEKAIVSSIISFWFCDRALRKMK
jgi:hypothetical protein